MFGVVWGRMRIELLLTALLLSSSQAVAQSCTEFLPNRSDHNLVRIELNDPDSFPAKVRDGIQDGMGQWNASSCNVNQTSFPMFSQSAPSSAPVISVTWRTGVAENDEGGHTVCAEIPTRMPDGTSAEVVMYEKSRLADGRVIDCYSSKALANDSFAHELGHYLGLAHPSCASQNAPRIMEPRTLGSFNNVPVWETDRAVRADECEAADNKNDTEEEQQCQRGDPNCDPEADPASPIVLDMDGGGFAFSGERDAVLFDLDADGVLDWVSWTAAGSRDAFLAMDRNHNGRIDDGSELFGDATPLDSGTTARHGYEALELLDLPALGGNRDGFLDERDVAYSDLLLWTDRNRDGISQQDELISVSDAGVFAFELRYVESRRRDRHGNLLRYRSRAWRQSGEHIRLLQVVDVFLRLW